MKVTTDTFWIYWKKLSNGTGSESTRSASSITSETQRVRVEFIPNVRGI
jgi:hypothetical protein